MAKDKVNWDWVNEWKKDPNPLGMKEEFKCLWIPYGLPEVVDPEGTKYGINIEVPAEMEHSQKSVCIPDHCRRFLQQKGEPQSSDTGG